MLVKCLLISALVKCLLAPHGPDDGPLLRYGTSCLNTDTCYTVSEQKTTYSDAWYDCHRNGGFLAMPKTAAEKDFIRNTILGTGDHEPVWIGLTDIFNDMSFRWNDQGDLSTSAFWKLNEPKDSKGHDEDCVEIRKDGFNNAQCEVIENRHLCQNYPQECLSGSPFVFGERCYRLYTGDFSQNAVACPDNGTLAMPKTPIISDYLDRINLYDQNLWIGLNYTIDRGFAWADGENASSTADYAYFNKKFVGGYPETQNVSALFAYLTASGKWDVATEGTDTRISYVCEYRMKADCGPTSVTNGNSISQQTMEGHTHVIVCDPSFVPSFSTTTCASNGIWSPTPACLKDCGPPVYNYGTAAVHVTTEGATYSVTCEAGFAPEYAETVCMPNGSWVPQPNCLIADGYCIDTCMNYTVDSRQLDALVQNLTLDRGNLSSTRRRLSSAEDNRFMSKCLGISGAAIICAFCGVFVIIDLTSLLCSKSRTRVKPQGQSGMSGVAIICSFCGAFVCLDGNRLWWSKSSTCTTPQGQRGISGVAIMCGLCGALVCLDQTSLLCSTPSIRDTPHGQRGDDSEPSCADIKCPTPIDINSADHTLV